MDLIPDLFIKSLSGALAILTSMITPALLISATGTFILSTSHRLGRVIDRARVVSHTVETLLHADSTVELLDERRAEMLRQMDRLSIRATLLMRSLTVLYSASGLFIATSVAIGVLSFVPPAFAWIAVVFGIAGSLLLFVASMLLIVEARMAVNSLKKEMGFLSKLVMTGAKARLG